MTPVTCMVTDRLRFGDSWERVLVDRVAGAARAGVHLIQIRERELDTRTLTSFTSRAVAAVRGTRTRILVNDRIDIAIAAGAHGVHLRADSVPASRARAIAPPGFIIGRSVHSQEEASATQSDEGLDYLLFGTVFETASKPGATAAGVEVLRAVAAAITLPVLAIGGVTEANAGALGRAGAAGFAAIGLFAEGPLQALAGRLERACRAFDTPGSVP